MKGIGGKVVATEKNCSEQTEKFKKGFLGDCSPPATKCWKYTCKHVHQKRGQLVWHASGILWAAKFPKTKSPWAVG
jgi:hypothetical protein